MSWFALQIKKKKKVSQHFMHRNSLGNRNRYTDPCCFPPIVGVTVYSPVSLFLFFFLCFLLYHPDPLNYAARLKASVIYQVLTVACSPAMPSALDTNMRFKFSILALLLEVIIIVLFGIFVEYDNSDASQSLYPRKCCCLRFIEVRISLNQI